MEEPRRARSFYQTFPQGSAIPPELGRSEIRSTALIELPDDNEQVLAARYQMYLPTEEELRAELAREREEAERVLRLTADVKGPGDGEG